MPIQVKKVQLKLKDGQEYKDGDLLFNVDAQAWATGKRNRVDVASTDQTYQNNAAYYSQQAHDSADAAAVAALEGNLATIFDPTESYSIGDYVIYDGTLYRFKVDHAAGAWNAAQVDQKKVDEVLKEFKDQIDDYIVINEDATDNTKIYIETTDEDVDLALSSQLNAVANAVTAVNQQVNNVKQSLETFLQNGKTNPNFNFILGYSTTTQIGQTLDLVETNIGRYSMDPISRLPLGDYIFTTTNNYRVQILIINSNGVIIATPTNGLVKGEFRYTASQSVYTFITYAAPTDSSSYTKQNVLDNINCVYIPMAVTTDKTLTLVDKAADAKSTGEMITIDDNSGEGTKINITTSDEDIEIPTMDDVEGLIEDVDNLKTQVGMPNAYPISLDQIQGGFSTVVGTEIELTTSTNTRRTSFIPTAGKTYIITLTNRDFGAVETYIAAIDDENIIVNTYATFLKNTESLERTYRLSFDNLVKTVWVKSKYGNPIVVEEEIPLAEDINNLQNKMNDVYPIVSTIPNGLLPYLEFVKGNIGSSGNPSSSNTIIRTTTAVMYDVDTFIRCISTEFHFSIRRYSASEINSDNYIEYKGVKEGTYLLKAGEYYVITVAKRDGSTVDNIDTWSKQIEVWSPMYLEMMHQYELHRFAPFGNAKRKIIGHQGNSVNNPGNTIPAFEAAGSGGAWGIETDIRATSDGYLVCIHDRDLSNTTTGSGNVDDKTLAEIEALSIKNHPDLKVPTLEQFLSICKIYDCVPVLELKTPMDQDQSLVKKVIDTLVEYGLDSKSIIIATIYNIGYIRCVTSKIPCVFIINPENLVDEINSVSRFFNVCVSWNSNSYTITHETVSALHTAGIGVCVGSVNTVSAIKDYFAIGVDAVSSDAITTY